MPYDPIIVKVKTDKTTAVVASSGGASFGVVNVTGQNNVVATKTTDILKVRPGTGVSITTDAPNNTLTITATGGSAFDSVARDIANGAFEQANSAALRANTLVTDNVPETSTNLYFTAARVRANVSNTAPINYDASTGTFSHAASGVTATGYGDAASIPVFVVNATGHVTSVTNTAIAIAASQITSGTLSVTRGGTGQTSITVNGAILIANTVSGGYDVNRITQTAPVIVTNDKGSITLSHASSGVTPTTYGNANHVSQITVDGFGHVTSSVNTRIGIGASQITSGATANGQLLIGNTVSGAFDVATLTQGDGILITNNKGSITIGTSTTAYAQLSSNVNQVPANGNGFIITFDTQDSLVGMTHTLGNTRLIVSSNGLYHIIVAPQISKTTGVLNVFIDCWIRKNGVNLPNSSARQSVEKGSDIKVMNINYIAELVANDYIEIMQAISDSTSGIGLYRYTGLDGATIVPSIILTCIKLR